MYRKGSGGSIDRNQKIIIDAFKKSGATVFPSNYAGGGFPDLVVGVCSVNFLVEIKNLENSYGKKGLNKNQLEFKKNWTGGEIFIVTSPEEAINLVSKIRKHQQSVNKSLSELARLKAVVKDH